MDVRLIILAAAFALVIIALIVFVVAVVRDRRDRRVMQDTHIHYVPVQPMLVAPGITTSLEGLNLEVAEDAPTAALLTPLRTGEWSPPQTPAPVDQLAGAALQERIIDYVPAPEIREPAFTTEQYQSWVVGEQATAPQVPSPAPVTAPTPVPVTAPAPVPVVAEPAPPAPAAAPVAVPPPVAAPAVVAAPVVAPVAMPVAAPAPVAATAPEPVQPAVVVPTPPPAMPEAPAPAAIPQAQTAEAAFDAELAALMPTIEFAPVEQATIPVSQPMPEPVPVAPQPAPAPVVTPPPVPVLEPVAVVPPQPAVAQPVAPAPAPMPQPAPAPVAAPVTTLPPVAQPVVPAPAPVSAATPIPAPVLTPQPAPELVAPAAPAPVASEIEDDSALWEGLLREQQPDARPSASRPAAPAAPRPAARISEPRPAEPVQPAPAAVPTPVAPAAVVPERPHRRVTVRVASTVVETHAESATEMPAQAKQHATGDVPELVMAAPVEMWFGESRIGVKAGTPTYDRFRKYADVLLGDLQATRSVAR